MSDPQQEVEIIPEFTGPLVPVFIFEKGGLTRVNFSRHRDKNGQDQVSDEDLSLPQDFLDKHPKTLIQRKYRQGITHYLPIDPEEQPETYKRAGEILKRQLVLGGPKDAIFVTLVPQEEVGKLVADGYPIFYPREINDLLDRYENEELSRQKGQG